MKQQLWFPLLFLSMLLALSSAAAAQEESSGILLVLNKNENHLALVDPATGRIIARVPTGEQPHEVAASADGRYAFVTNYGTEERPGNTISMIDLAARKEIRRIDLGPLVRPHGIKEAGGKLYFTAEASHAIARYDLAAHRVDWIAGTGQAKTHMLAVTPDGRKIYTANGGADSVTAIEVDAWNGASRISQIPVGQLPEGIDCSPDGKEIWVAHLADGEISVLDTATDKVKLRIRGGTTPIRLKFTPDGRHVLLSNLQSGELSLLDAKTRRIVKQLGVGPAPTNLLISPGRARAYVSLAGNNRVAVIDLGTFTVKAAFDAGAGPDGLAWATVNTKIALEAYVK